LRVILYVIAALLIAAHFYRGGNFLMVVLCAAAPLLFLWKHRASLIVLQVLAYVAAAMWVMTAVELVQYRQSIGRPWTAAVVILGTVAAFSVVAGALLNSRKTWQRYRGTEPESGV
jgi:uncharacterized membrane protein HdeD (DUF308 family)